MLNTPPVVGLGDFSRRFHQHRSRRRSVCCVGGQIERLERREYLSSLDGTAPDATADRIVPAFIEFERVPQFSWRYGVGQPHGIAALANGHWIGGGVVWNGSDYDVGVTRFLATGAIDASFGNRGIVSLTTGPGDEMVRGIVVQPDGKTVILVQDSSLTYPQWRPDITINAVFLRINPDGTLDTTFGEAGTAYVRTSSVGMHRSPQSMQVQSDGRVLVTIDEWGSSEGAKLAHYLMRFHPDGTPDQSFAVDGELIFNAEGFARRPFIVDSNDRILTLHSEAGSIVVTRFDRDGRLDTSFGHDGTVAISDTSDEFRLGGVLKLHMLPDDGIVVAADLNPNVDSFWLLSSVRFLAPPSGLLVARLTSEGQLDSTFGGDGVVTQSLRTGWVAPGWIELQPDGNVLVTAHTIPAVGGRWNRPAEMMLLLDRAGEPVSSFGLQGLLTLEGDSQVHLVPPRLIRSGPHQPPVIASQSERGLPPSQIDDSSIPPQVAPARTTLDAGLLFAATNQPQLGAVTILDDVAAVSDSPSEDQHNQPVLSDDVDAFWESIGQRLLDGGTEESDSVGVVELIDALDAR